MPAAVNILLFGSLIFQPPAAFPDLDLEFGAPANAKANPVNMPTASAYLVSGRDGSWLEDRFDVFELWRADAIRARWTDADGSSFSICRIPRMVPDEGSDPRTRRDFTKRFAKATLGPKDLEALDEAVCLLAPVCVTERLAPRRSQRRNLSALWQYATTNENAFVYAFRPRAAGRVQTDWYMVSLMSDDPDAAEKLDEWIDGVDWSGERQGGQASRPSGRKASEPSETDLLAADYRRNVVNYADWHFASSSNLVVVDNMQDVDRRQFLNSLTNTFLKMQAAYRSVLPSPLTDASHIAAVRVFGSRNEYLGYVGWEMKWSAALWSPEHRELVLYYPPGGSETLLHTVWHEALHQHLDYACSMLQAPAWFNEGHAELFEHTHFDMDGNLVFDIEPEAAQVMRQNAADLADSLSLLLDMDYPEFYAGSSEEKRLKYQLAWSVAYFLQEGAPKVRFQPFKNLRADLMDALVRTRRRDEAMRTVLNGELRKTLVREWISFWKHH
jgi:hypothetical protein